MFENMMKEMDRRFTKQKKDFEFCVENTIMPKINIFSEVLPGAAKSYQKLEERVDRIELEQDVLNRTVWVLKSKLT